MSVIIKSEHEIKLMREAGNILGMVHDELKTLVQPGISTFDLDRRAYDMIKSYGCTPSFLNYNGFPASLCVSINDQVVHGIPNKKTFLREGDIISIDAGVIYKGYHSDAARTWAVGEVSLEARKLIEVTRESFYEGIKYAKAGNHLNDISSAIEEYVKPFGFSIVRDLVGHGIGKNLHEEPQIPNFRTRRRGVELVPGMTLAIEPMINIGGYNVRWLEDKWTVVTTDKSLSAHYENTVLITTGEPEILSVAQNKL